MNDTTGKIICTPNGVIATDVGAATIRIRDKKFQDPIVRKMRADAGYEFYLIARVVRDLPQVTRRASFSESS